MAAGMYDLQLPLHWCCTHLTTVGKDVSLYSSTIQIYLVSEQQFIARPSSGTAAAPDAAAALTASGRPRTMQLQRWSTKFFRAALGIQVVP